MTGNDNPNHTAAALVALRLQPGKPNGVAPSAVEVEAWRRGELDATRADEVFSHLAHNPEAASMLAELEALDALDEQGGAITPVQSVAAQPAAIEPRWRVQRWLATGVAAALVALVTLPMFSPDSLEEQLLGSHTKWLDGAPSAPVFSVYALKSGLETDAVLTLLRSGAADSARELGWTNDAQWARWADHTTAVCRGDCDEPQRLIRFGGQWLLQVHQSCGETAPTDLDHLRASALRGHPAVRGTVVDRELRKVDPEKSETLCHAAARLLGL